MTSSNPKKKAAKVVISGWVSATTSKSIKAEASADDRSVSSLVGKIITGWAREQRNQQKAS